MNSPSQELSTTYESLSIVNAQSGTFTNTTSFLYSFPNELITHIFEAGFQTSKTFPILVSHISHHLREIALHSPTLWRRIFLSIGDDDENVNAYLQRSKECLLDVTVVADRLDLDAPSHHIHLSNILSHVTRWRSLEVSGASADMVLQELAEVSAPFLERLRVNGNNLDDWSESNQLFGGDLPKLSNADLSLSGVGWWRSISTKAITSFKINESMFSTYNDLFCFLRSAPLLSDLTLREDSWPKEDSPQVHTIGVSIPCLLTLEIVGIPPSVRDWDEHLCSLSKALLTPSLRHLKLGTIPSSLLGPFARRLNDDANVHCLQYPELGSLEISTQSLNTETLGNLIYGLPNVTMVSLCAESDKDGTVLILLCDETAWPHLNVLTVDHFDEGNEGFMAILCHIIASRKSVGCLRLRTQRTTRWDVRDPPDDERIRNYLGDDTYGIKWLRNHVHVEYKNVCERCSEEWNHSHQTSKHKC